MTDRMVSVPEADLRAVERALQDRGVPETTARRRAEAIIIVRAALDALGPEPCGNWSKEVGYVDQRLLGGPLFTCIAPKGHHAYRRYYDSRGVLVTTSVCCDKPAYDPIHCGDAHQPPADVWSADD